jgi:hypothetical protein
MEVITVKEVFILTHPRVRRHSISCRTLKEDPQARVFVVGAQNIHWEKDNLFNKSFWENWSSPCKRLKLDPCLSPVQKINSKWIKDLNVNPKTLKPLWENTERTLEGMA